MCTGKSPAACFLSAGKFSTPAVVARLLEMMSDPDPNIRAVTAIALARSSKSPRRPKKKHMMHAEGAICQKCNRVKQSLKASLQRHIFICVMCQTQKYIHVTRTMAGSMMHEGKPRKAKWHSHLDKNFPFVEQSGAVEVF